MSDKHEGLRGKSQAPRALMEQALRAGKKVAFANAEGSWYITRSNGVTTWTPIPRTCERGLPELVIYDDYANCVELDAYLYAKRQAVALGVQGDE